SAAPPGPSDRETLASGRDAAGFAELWYGLPVRTRRAAAVAVCLVVLAGGGYALAAGQLTPERAPSTSRQGPGPGPGPDTALPSAASRRMPYPAQAAHITFDRLAVSDRSRRTFTVEMHATATVPLTVLDVGQGYDAVDLRLAGRQPLTVSPDGPRTLLLKARVTNCDRVPLRARSPFLNVTLRNSRARQELSVIPGERYADALTHAFRTLCGRDTPASPSDP
ncbi:hypothetical protein, partial [Streptomyces nanshensis]|uniref:hypothetical protein n=1 Tax=Streptomyces nanshensis TaxID=518642 RepID=UPI00085C37C6